MISKQSQNTLTNELENIQGQLKGLQKMIAAQRSCDDLLHQIVSVSGGLKNLAVDIINAYLDDYWKEEFQTGDEKPFADFQKSLSLISKL